MVDAASPENLQQHLSNLQHQGYTLIPDFLSPERLAKVQEVFDQLLAVAEGL